MKTGMMVCACWLVAVLAVAAEPVRVKLDFVRLEIPGPRGYSDYGAKSLYLDKTSSTGLAVSETVGESPLFGVLPLEGKKGPYAFALAKRPGSQWYEELYIDSNEDGEISADERFVTQAVEKPPVDIHPAGRFTPVVSTFDLDTPFGHAPDANTDYAFEISVTTYKGNENNLRVLFFTRCCRKGKAVIKGKNYDVTLIDRGWNGRFNDNAKHEDNKGTRSDGVVFVPEGEANPDVTVDMESLGDFRVIGDEVYEVSVPADGSEMMLTPSAMPCGRLMMKPVPERVDLASELGPFCVRRSESAILPVGKYEVTGINYERTMGDGTRWVLSGSGRSISAKVEIKPGKKTKLQFGPRFTSRVTCVRGSRGDINMEVELRGQGGERYSYYRESPDGNGIPPADVIIRTQNGKVVAQVKRTARTSVDCIPPDYTWAGPVPTDGAVATCDLALPWELKQEKTMIKAAEQEAKSKR